MISRQINFAFALGLCTSFLVSLTSINAYAGDIDNGKKLYARHCVTCHGVDGVNVMPDAPNFAYSERLLRPDDFILASIKAGKNAMPAYRGLLEDQDILDVITYLRLLENGGPIRP